MIVEKSDAVPYATTGGMDTVAVRMPNHPIALDLIRRSGCLIAAPSANTSGRPSPTEAAHVAEDLSGKIAMIIDGGPVGIGIESTIIDDRGYTYGAASGLYYTTDAFKGIRQRGYHRSGNHSGR